MTKRKKMKLKKSVKKTLLLIIAIIVIINILPKLKKEEPKIINKQDILLKQNTYLNKTKNSTDTTIKEGWENLIVNYLDLYYKSLIRLNTKDTSHLFTKKDSNYSYFINNAIDLLVYHHKIQTNDMTLTKCSYDIEYENVSIEDNLVTINFLVDDYINFSYLKDIESREIDVEYEIVIRKTKDKYTIDSLEIVQGNFVMFTNEIDLTESNAKEEIDKLMKKYKEKIDDDLEENKELLKEANEEKYETFIKCDKKYDREKAVEYSYKYVDKRNEDYYEFDDIGGNCQNYVSQSIHEAGIPMDLDGEYEWKFYDDEINEDNEKSGRSTSWTGTINFYDYAKGNKDSGMCTDVDENIFYAEPGDVAHVGYNGYSHSTIVVKKIYDSNGKIIDFLVNSNTASLKDYPFLGYVYPNKRVIKILGYND